MREWRLRKGFGGRGGFKGECGGERGGRDGDVGGGSLGCGVGRGSLDGGHRLLVMDED